MSGNYVARLSQDFEFADGVVRTVRPMTIKNLKKFVKLYGDTDLKELANSTLDESQMDIMLDAASLIMEATDKDLANDRERLEIAVDTDVFQKIMQVGMGSRFTDPNE